MSGPLNVVASGMVTSVGLDAEAACAAMRACLDGFQETTFPAAGGALQIGGPVPMARDWVGAKRLANMAAMAIAEVFRKVPEAVDRSELILCLAEDGRPGRLTPDAMAFARQIRQAISTMPRNPPKLVPFGRPSGFAAVQQARQMLTQGAEYVMILGVDSYLTKRSIMHYSAGERLLTEENHEGFIPGEAATAVLCSTREPGTLSLRGLGLARERSYLNNRQGPEGLPLPMRGDGMTQAYKAALGQAGYQHSDIVLKIGDHIGESYSFRQTALSMLRTQRERSEVQPIWALGSTLGNVGAAVVPTMLAWAHAAVGKQYIPPGPILIEASADDGSCGALVVEAA